MHPPGKILGTPLELSVTFYLLLNHRDMNLWSIRSNVRFYAKFFKQKNEQNKYKILNGELKILYSVKHNSCAQIAMISPSLSSCEHTLNTLRYADRVKELGAADPVESRTRQLDLYEDDESARMDDGVMSPEDSDLAQLRSAGNLRYHFCIIPIIPFRLSLVNLRHQCFAGR